MHFLAALLLQATAFVGVNVLPMDGGPPRTGQTVIVRDARVEQQIGPVAEVEVPSDAKVVYGRGRWLVPGLVDMHVHIRAVDLPARRWWWPKKATPQTADRSVVLRDTRPAH